MIRALFEEQGSRGAYTGELLVPGVTASLDHKLPMSRGGLHGAGQPSVGNYPGHSMKADLTQSDGGGFGGFASASHCGVVPAPGNLSSQS